MLKVVFLVVWRDCILMYFLKLCCNIFCCLGFPCLALSSSAYLCARRCDALTRQGLTFNVLLRVGNAKVKVILL